MSVGVALPVVILLAALLALPVLLVRRQWPLAVGLAAAGVGVAVQSPPVYAALDPWLGGQNLTNLGYHLATVVGIAAFLLVVLTADPRRDRRRTTRVVTVAAAVACVLEAALFGLGWMTAGWGTADGHLTSKLTTPVFLVYASVLWVGLAVLAVATIVSVRTQTRGRPWSVGRAGTSLVVAGSVAALCWCVNAIGRAVVAVLSGRPPSAVDMVGQLLALLAGIGVFAGVAVINLPHVAAWWRQVRLRSTTRRLWLRAVQTAPEVTLSVPGRRWPAGQATLYRRWVEIEDALRLGRLELTDQEREQVTSMQRIFAPAAALAVARPGSGPR